ncbi:hypothetical protein ANO11243_058970 [Dothideomycetidae sp. 11243]|nr:hypothetical protein ANO11243_058970 [fungal sp. No.11243]
MTETLGGARADDEKQDPMIGMHDAGFDRPQHCRTCSRAHIDDNDDSSEQWERSKAIERSSSAQRQPFRTGIGCATAGGVAAVASVGGARESSTADGKRVKGLRRREAFKIASDSLHLHLHLAGPAGHSCAQRTKG